MVTYITAQYRHVVVCSGLYPVRSQSLHGGYSSGCFESAMQPLPRRKAVERLCITSYKMTVHVILSYPPCFPPDIVSQRPFFFQTGSFFSINPLPAQALTTIHLYLILLIYGAPSPSHSISSCLLIMLCSRAVTNN